MKKKFLSTVAIILTLSLLTGCQSGSSGNSTAIKSSSVEETSAETDAYSSEETSSTDTVSDSTQEQETAETTVDTLDLESFKVALDTTIEETSIFDDGTVSVKAKELVFKNNSPVLNLEINNNSEKTLTFLAGTLGYSCNSVNGFMVSTGYLNSEVSPGKTAVESVSFDVDELVLHGIKEVSEIKFAISISDEDYNDYADTEPVSIKTSAYDKWDPSEDTYQTALHSGIYKLAYDCDIIWESKEPYFEGEDICISSATILKNKDDNLGLLLEIDNRSDKIVNFRLSDIDINGLVLSSGAWTIETIDKNTRCIMNVDLNQVAEHGAGSFEILGIKDISNIGFLCDIEDIDRNDLKSEELRLDINGKNESSELTGDELYNDNDVIISSIARTDSNSMYYDLVLMIHNNSEKLINVDVDYDSLSVNDIMANFLNYSLTLNPNKKGLLKVQINKSDAEKIGINSLEDIKNVEFTLEIKDYNTYDEIDTPLIKIAY